MKVFKVSRRFRWNKHLKYGSLVCLSADNFQNSLLFATVSDRNDENISKGKIGLSFLHDDPIDTKAKYLMVESPTFYEAYRPVMLALQVCYLLAISSQTYCQNILANSTR